MLCSHGKKFIYLKTAKTAGTSVEIFFEKYCCPISGYKETHGTSAIISKEGIIGSRGSNHRHSNFYSHMHAEKARELLGSDIWKSYFKFCVIRNPFDKVVSMFWMSINNEDRLILNNSSFEVVRKKFAQFSQDPSNFPNDKKVFMINNNVAVDYFIRFEHLVRDLETVCDLLHIDQPIENLRSYKSNIRLRHEHFSEYYDQSSQKAVADFYSWEISNFKYKLID